MNSAVATPNEDSANVGDTNIMVKMATIMPAAAVHHRKYLKVGRKLGAALSFKTVQARLRTAYVKSAVNVTIEAMISTLGAVHTSKMKATVKKIAREGVSVFGAPFLNGFKKGSKLSLYVDFSILVYRANQSTQVNGYLAIA